jgi:hypothetical protein
MGAQHRQFSADRRQGFVKKSASELEFRARARRYRDGQARELVRRGLERRPAAPGYAALAIAAG